MINVKQELRHVVVLLSYQFNLTAARLKKGTAEVLEFHVYLQSILLTKTTAAQNEVALSYHKVHGLYFLAVVFEETITMPYVHI